MKGRLEELLDAGHGCWNCKSKLPDQYDCGNHRCCLWAVPPAGEMGIRGVCPRWELVASKPAPAPRDREIAVLRAQVRVLAEKLRSVHGGPCGNWECGSTGTIDCPFNSAVCWERMSRQQAEKEVNRESKA